MKKITSTSLLLLTFLSLTFAQIKTGITSAEEYNYMQKGYQFQVSNGLDMKKGYSLGPSTFHDAGSYEFYFMPLLRESQNDSVFIGYIVKAVSTSWSNTYWYGLPTGNQKLLDHSFSLISNLDESMTTAFFKAYAELNLVPQEE